METVSPGFSRLVFVAVGVLLPGCLLLAQTQSGPAASAPQRIAVDPPAFMSESLRSDAKKIVVVAGEGPAKEEISGSYEKATPGLIGGMNQGSRLGTISQEIGGVNVNFPIPILTIPGAIYGGLSGATKREIQEFRDALTEELASAESKPLTNDGLALDVYRELGKLPGQQAKLFAPGVQLPEDTDAVLYVSFSDIGIDVQGHDAVLTVSAKASVQSPGDGLELFGTTVRYQDRDTLGNWTENDNALWRDYANFAAHYLGREISAVVFERADVPHELRPKKTATTARDRKNERQFVSRSPTPALAWELDLDVENAKVPWAAAIDESAIYYDVEIYTKHRLVYSQKQVSDPGHVVLMELEPCRTYRWSVRPSFHVDGKVRYGEWMRLEPDTDDEADGGYGMIGRSASIAPAYIQDFPLLEIKCGRR